jgi:hypothetical protein
LSFDNPMKKFPARIHVLLAREARVGLVIRRGPSKSVATYLWDRRTDQFTLGQWMRGRIYERRCDLSPDGKYFIYFAMNGKWKSETKGSWTAISMVPYLKAITLLPKGECWNGGGLFTSDRSYALNDGFGHSISFEDSSVKRDLSNIPAMAHRGECPGVYYPRLVRDGWSIGDSSRPGVWEDLDVFEKQLPGGWTLRKFAHAEIPVDPGKSCYWDEHDLEHLESGTRIRCGDWEWADYDEGQLMWATKGKIWRGRLQRSGIHEEQMLCDFNGMSFEAKPAPY